MTEAAFCLGFACGVAAVAGTVAIGFVSGALYFYLTDGK